jgi:hypothetical protein
MLTSYSVGMLVVKTLLHPQQSKNKALKVNSFTTTHKEILEAFEKHCGGKKWTVKYTSNHKLRDLERNAWLGKHPMTPIFTLRRIWSEGGTLYENETTNLLVRRERRR